MGDLISFYVSENAPKYPMRRIIFSISKCIVIGAIGLLQPDEGLLSIIFVDGFL